jgi:hypothetical protein
MDICLPSRRISTIVMIERAFALLRGRWRRLEFLDMNSVLEMADVVAAGCVLHNFCIASDGGDDMDDYMQGNADDDDGGGSECDDQPQQQASHKQTLLVQFLANV